MPRASGGRTGPGGAHEVSFGVHGDRYVLINPVYQTPNWSGGPDATGPALFAQRGQDADARRCGRRTPGALRRSGS